MGDQQFLKSIGEKIRSKREKLKMSVPEFAEQIGISKVHLYRIEDGNNSMNLVLYIKICKALDVRPGKLLDSI